MAKKRKKIIWEFIRLNRGKGSSGRIIRRRKRGYTTRKIIKNGVVQRIFQTAAKKKKAAAELEKKGKL